MGTHTYIYFVCLRCHSSSYLLKVSEASCRVSGWGLPADPRAEPPSEPETSLCASSSGLLGASECPVKGQSEGAILRQMDGTQRPAGPGLQCLSGLPVAKSGHEKACVSQCPQGSVVKFVMLPMRVTPAHPGAASLGIAGSHVILTMWSRVSQSCTLDPAVVKSRSKGMELGHKTMGGHEAKGRTL